MPAVIIIYYTLELYGRKIAIASFMTLAGVFCIGSKFMGGSMTTVMSLLAKLCIAGAFKV